MIPLGLWAGKRSVVRNSIALVRYLTIGIASDRHLHCSGGTICLNPASWSEKVGQLFVVDLAVVH